MLCENDSKNILVTITHGDIKYYLVLKDKKNKKGINEFNED
jgi:hypothetical protein